MRVIINISNLIVGGAKQVAYSVLKELSDDNEYHVFMSIEMSDEINQQEFNSNYTFYIVQNKPRPFFFGIPARKELAILESKVNPDFVFSVFGPVYWTPKSMHTSGFAAGWVINPKSIAFNVLSIKELLKIKIMNMVKLYYINKGESDQYIVESDIVKKQLAKYSNVKEKKIFVVSNTYGTHYEKTSSPSPFIEEMGFDEYFKFITISANYVHKNLIIISHIIPLIKKKKLKVKFFVTLKPVDFENLFSGFEDYVINLGYLKVIDCPPYYKACDALFLPTLLESFTASYPEAMKMELPILTSDLDFAHGICNDAALYCNPLSEEDIVMKIEELINDEFLRKKLIKNGLEQLKRFDSARDRSSKYMQISAGKHLQ